MCVIERENNMFETDTKPRTQNDLARIKALYNRAFPENERRPFDDMMASLNNRLKLNVFYAEGAFVGFAFLLNCGDISHIIYFAGRAWAARRLKPCARKIPECGCWSI